jgi:hypothetical protein
MSDIGIKIKNEESTPVYLQVEYWADLFYLLPGETMHFVVREAGVEFEQDSDQNGNTKYLFIAGASEYFISEGGELINHMDYGSNVIGWSSPIHEKSSLKGSVRHPLAKT